MSETSTPYTPTSISTIIAKNKMVTLADDIKKYDTTKLIDFLYGEKDLGLIKDDFDIIENERVNGCDFFNMTKQGF